MLWSSSMDWAYFLPMDYLESNAAQFWLFYTYLFILVLYPFKITKFQGSTIIVSTPIPFPNSNFILSLVFEVLDLGS